MPFLPVYMRAILSRLFSPTRLFVFSFAGVILAGGILLWLPSSAPTGHLRFVDALFTSTSAVCVTGLVVVDTGKDLSTLGQVITMLLIQTGGLGIITFSTVFFLLMGRSASFKGREIVQSTYLHTPRGDFVAVARAVLLLTLVSETVGALLLFFRFSRDFSFGTAVYHSFYHAVSAFNNAGFALYSDSFMAFTGDIVVNLTVMGLIVHGGIGFIVQYEVLDYLIGRGKRLSAHTKIVLISTMILISSGAILFYFFERNYILKGMPFLTQLLASIFQSVTPRTAGFNTVHIGSLTNPTILLLILLMFVGASPGSTGGGVKTTSATLLVMLIWNRLKGSVEVNIFNRTIPREIVSRTISIIFASGFSVAIIWSVLLVSGAGVNPLESRHLFVEYLFETVSAFGTVGLSMGITPKLHDIQKYGVILMMFAGRVGPLTLAFSLSREAGKRSLIYAEESVMVG